MKRRLQKVLQQLKFSQILGLFFALLVSLGLLSACTNQSVVNLCFVVPEREADHWLPLIDQFNNNNGKIHVGLTNRTCNNNRQNPNSSDDVKEIYSADFYRDTPLYDLIYMDIIWVPEFAEKEWLVDLTQKFPSEDLRDFLPSEVENGRYEGGLYRIPFRSDVGVLFYRQDWLVNEKRPETFDELKIISKKVKEQESITHGYFWQGKPDEGLVAMFFEVLKGFDGFWIENGKVRLNESEAGKESKAIRAVEFLRDTIDLGISPKDFTSYEEEATRSGFRQGEAVFMRNWPNVWLDMNRSEPPFSDKFAIKSVVHEGERAKGERGVACRGGWGFGIAAKSPKHKQEAALKVIQFFTSAASQQKFTLEYASVPSRQSLFFEPKIVAKYSHYPKLLEFVENSVARPPTPKYAQASCILQKHLVEALNPNKNKKDYEEEMKTAAKKTQELLDTKNPDVADSIMKSYECGT